MIPAFDYRPTYRAQKKEIDEAIARVLESGQLILGPEVEAFEGEFSDWLGAGFGIGVNSGTDALILALRALHIGPGDEVVTVANAGVPTLAAIRATGATPVLVDVRADTLLINPDELEKAATDRTRCILPVHLYGQAADMDSILDFASRRSLSVVEDCAQAHGTRYRGKAVGSLGQIGCFSFYPTKNLGAYGDGGMCVTTDPQLEQRIRAQRMYGFRKDKHAHEEGLNSRLDEIQAAILRVKLRALDSVVSDRRKLAAQYLGGLDHSLYRPQAETPGSEHSYHLFVVSTDDREGACRALEREDIGFGIHYPEPVHLMEAYESLGYERGSLPVSERASSIVLSLPLYPGLSTEAVDKVVEVLSRHASGRR